jgi:hypothetical protein
MLRQFQMNDVFPLKNWKILLAIVVALFLGYLSSHLQTRAIDHSYTELPTSMVTISGEHSPVFIRLKKISHRSIRFPDKIDPHKLFKPGCWSDTIKDGNLDVEVFVSPTHLGEGIQYLCIESSRGDPKSWILCRDWGGTCKYSYGTISGTSDEGLHGQLYYPYHGIEEFPYLVGSLDEVRKPIEGSLGYHKESGDESSVLGYLKGWIQSCQEWFQVSRIILEVPTHHSAGTWGSKVMARSCSRTLAAFFSSFGSGNAFQQNANEPL